MKKSPNKKVLRQACPSHGIYYIRNTRKKRVKLFELVEISGKKKMRIADMLTKGFTMGNVDISKKIDRFQDDADKDILKLAKELLDFGQKNIELLKPYL